MFEYIDANILWVDTFNQVNKISNWNTKKSVKYV